MMGTGREDEPQMNTVGHRFGAGWDEPPMASTIPVEEAAIDT
jgi:hypothetical protein